MKRDRTDVSFNDGELRLVCLEPWCRLERMLSAASSLGRCLLGKAVVKETANERIVLDICNDQLARWNIKVAIQIAWKMKFSAKYGIKLCLSLDPEILAGSGGHR